MYHICKESTLNWVLCLYKCQEGGDTEKSKHGSLHQFTNMRCQEDQIQTKDGKTRTNFIIHNTA